MEVSCAIYRLGGWNGPSAQFMPNRSTREDRNALGTIKPSHLSPEAGSACPNHDLLDNSATGGRSASLADLSTFVLRSTAAAAPTSIGSPRGVPVPWSDRAVTSKGDKDDDALLRSCPRGSPRACLMTACWAGPLGAVRLLLRPSWLTDAPARMAIKGGVSRSGSVPRVDVDKKNVPHASALTYPSAEASSVLQRPSGESMPV